MNRILQNLRLCFDFKITVIVLALSAFGSHLSLALPKVSNSYPFDETVLRIEKLDHSPQLITDYQGEQHYTNLKFIPYSSTIVGSGLCNKFIGHYDLNGNHLIIKDVKKSNLKCISDEVNQQDHVFFHNLEQVRFYQIDGKVIKLLDNDKKILIVVKSIK